MSEQEQEQKQKQIKVQKKKRKQKFNNADDVRKKREKYFKDLRQQLHHTSKSDAKIGQDISEKHKTKAYKHQDGIMNRYVAISLVKIANKGKESITYKNPNEDITAKSCSSNRYALLKSLESVHFIKVLSSMPLSTITIDKITITSIGKKYIQKYIPKNDRIYKYLKYGKNSMYSSSHCHLLGKHFVKLIIFFVIDLCLGFGSFILNGGHHLMNTHSEEYNNPIMQVYTSVNNMQYYMINFIITITVVVGLILFFFIIGYIYTHRDTIKYRHYRNENVGKDIHKATRLKFVKFLKQNHIREPDYRFGYNRHLPKINYCLFDNKKEA